MKIVDIIWSPADRQQVRTIGQKTYPLAAYARGLLTQITGEILYPDVELAGPNLDFRSDQKVNRETSKLLLRPNPVSDILTIDYSDSENEITSYRIFDIHGKIILLGTDKQIDLSVHNSGVYMIQIQLSDGKIMNEKISKL